MVFAADLTDTSGGNDDDQGIFVIHSSGDVQSIVREGDLALDGTHVITNVSWAYPNGAGQYAYSAKVEPVTGGESKIAAFVTDESLTPTLVAMEGQSTPNGLGTLRGPAIYGFSNAGEVVFYSFVLGTGPGGGFGDGVFLGSATEPLVQLGGAGVALPNGEAFAVSYAPIMNDSGNVSFMASMETNGGGAGRYSAVFRTDDTGSLEQLIRTGDTAPDSNGQFSYFSDSYFNDVNNSGSVVFVADLVGTDGGTTDNSGLFVADAPGSVRQIVREGQSDPQGTGEIVYFDEYVFNEAGQVTFFGAVSISGEPGFAQALFRGDGRGELIEIIRDGQPAPDGSGHFQYINGPQGGVINNAGQVAFDTNIQEPSGNYLDVVYLYDDTKGLIQVAREGDELLGSTISRVFVGDGLDERGRVAFYFELEDGSSGMALWSTPVPEPGSAALLALLGGLACQQSRRLRSSRAD